MLTYKTSHAEHSWSWAVTAGMWMPRGQLVDADPPGLWLLSETPCSVVHITCTKQGLSPEFVLDLKDRPQFVRRTLEPGRFDYFLTCPEHGAVTKQTMSRGHVMAVAIQDGDHGQTILALHFHASHGGLECASILQVCSQSESELTIHMALRITVIQCTPLCSRFKEE